MAITNSAGAAAAESVSEARRRAELIGASLKWKRAGTGWRLFDGSRRFGDVVPDRKHPGMWRRVLSGGRLSDMANLSWARNAVLEAATRELQYEARHGAEIDPSFTRDSGGVFESKSPHIARNHSGAVMSPDDSESRDWPPYEGAQ